MHFLEDFGQRRCSFGSKTVFLGQKVPYYMVNIAYYTEFNLQICNYAQKRRICRGNSKDVPDKNFCGHFCPRGKAANFCHPVLSMIFFITKFTYNKYCFLKKRPLEMGWLGPRKSCLLFRISLAQLVRVWGTKRQNCQEIKTSNADHLKTQGNWVINKGAGISISYPVEFWDGEFACKGAITWRYKGFIMVMLNHAIILLISQLYYLYYNYITWRYKGSSWWD